ncbi:magnesium/cobalt transporter CorA [Sphingomonas oligophenolica]
MTIRAYLYDAAGHDREVSIDEVDAGSMTDQTLLWIDLEDVGEEERKRVAELLAIELPSSLACVADPGEPRLQNFGAFLSIRLSLPRTNELSAENDQPRLADSNDTTLFLISSRWLVTAHAGKAPLLEQFRDKDRAETMIGALSPASLAAALFDWHLGLFFEAASAIAIDVDALDERVLRDRANKSLLGRIVMLRRKTSRLRIALVGNRAVFYGLSRPDCSIVSQSDAAEHYMMLVARFERGLDEIERVRDLINGSFDLFTSRSGLQTNALIKALTIITAILGYVGAVAGVFGMNLKSSLFEGGDGELEMIVGFIAVTTILALVVARVRKWI